MKKKISIILVCLLVASFCVMAVAAQKDAQSVISLPKALVKGHSYELQFPEMSLTVNGQAVTESFVADGTEAVLAYTDSTGAEIGSYTLPVVDTNGSLNRCAYFYDETGKRVRTKKEITGEDGQIRKGCTVIKKGEPYERHLFTAKDDVFKNELFLDEAKQFYTALINQHIQDPERRLKVFDPNSVYLSTKKIGKNNPKAAEIEADNAARQDWNRTADMALVSGIAEAKIIEIRNEHVYNEATRSVQKHGWLPGLFRGIIQKAKEILMGLIRETEAPPKPTLSVDMAEYRRMQKLMGKVQDEARAIKQLMHGELPKLEKQLAETAGLFKGKERKALQEKIAGVQQEIDRRMDRLPGILKEDGYPDVQAFKRTYDAATALVEQYNRDLAEWERKVNGEKHPQQAPPEKESIRKILRDMEAEAKRRNDARRQQTRPRSHDYDRGR